MEKLSVLIPVFNAESTIAPLCERLIRELSALADLEIILVNDCSSDNSAEICRGLFDKFRRTITYIELSRNFGEHNALMAGFKHVTGDYCMTMDDDLQNPPEEATNLLDEIKKGYDVVYTNYDSKKDPWFRNIGSIVHNKMANVLLKKPSRLYLSSFKIVNSFIVNEIVKYDGQDPYIDGIILRSTNRISSIKVDHRERTHGKSGYTIVRLTSLWWRMVLNFSFVPIRIIGLLGTIVSVAAFVYAVYKSLFVEPYGQLTDIQTIMAVLMFLMGLVMLCIALAAEYIGRIYFSINKDPQFIIRNILKLEK